MVHKVLPVAGDSPAATGFRKIARGNIKSTDAKNSAFANNRSRATVAVLDGGRHCSVCCALPQEITGALTMRQLRTLEERLQYLREGKNVDHNLNSVFREQGKWMQHSKRQSGGRQQ